MSDAVLKVVNVSLHFNGHFPGGPGLAGTMSLFRILFELRMMDVMATTLEM